MTQLTPEQHIGRGAALLADAAEPGLAPSIAASLAQRASAHFLAAQALQGGPQTALASPLMVDASAVMAEARKRFIASRANRCGVVHVRLGGDWVDVAATLGLLEAKHIHLDGVTSPRVWDDGTGVDVYGTLDIEEWRAYRAKQAAGPERRSVAQALAESMPQPEGPVAPATGGDHG